MQVETHLLCSLVKQTILSLKFSLKLLPFLSYQSLCVCSSVFVSAYFTVFNQIPDL
jgi:hypothetical protein